MIIESNGLTFTILTDTTVSVTGAESSLTSCTLPAEVTENGVTYTVTTIAPYVFANHTLLQQVSIPNTVTSIGNAAFEMCTALLEANLASQLTEISRALFYRCKSLKEIQIPEGVTVIQEAAFDDCIALTSVQLPSTLEEINQDAFGGCINLGVIVIPANVKSIGNYAFADCNELAQISILGGLETVGDYAFGDCTALQQIVFPATLTSLGENVFILCTNLKQVIFEGDCPLGAQYLYNRANPGLITYCMANAFGWPTNGTWEERQLLRLAVIMPTQATFDKVETTPTPIEVTQTLGDETLTSITNGTTTLAPNVDYTITNNQVVLSNNYLQQLGVGSYNLIFHYSEGIGQQILHLKVISTSKPTVMEVIPDGDNVPTDGTIEVIFNHPMNPALGTITLSLPGTLSSGKWLNDRTYVVPYQNLEFHTTYTINIDGFEDTSGQSVETDPPYTFTTNAQDFPIIQGISVGMIGCESVRLSVEAISAVMPMRYQWQIQQNNRWVNLCQGTTPLYVLCGLVPCCSYTVRVIVINAHGHTTISNPVQFVAGMY